MRKVNYINKYPLVFVAVVVMLVVGGMELASPNGGMESRESRESRESFEGISGDVMFTKMWMLEVREGLLQRLRDTGMEEDVFAIVVAMTLGERSMMGDEVRDVFADTGVAHLLALSGLHLAIIASFLLLLVRPLRRRSPLLYSVCSLLMLLPIWMYVFLTGLRVSAVRAALMISICTIVYAFGRRYVGMNSLALSAIIILLFDPKCLFELSFQLSFLSLLGIFIILSWQEKRGSNLATSSNDGGNSKWLWCRRVFSMMGRRIIDLCLISLGAQMMTLPLVLYHFGSFCPYFMLTNIVAVPLTTAILYLACLWMMVVVMVPSVGMVFTVAVVFMVKLLMGCIRFVSTLPYAVLEGLQTTVLQTILLYAIIVMFLLWWKKNDAKRSELLLLTILTFLIVTYLC
ncbi:MAG: ComEC/Rec2 family competence protein [Prevotella sp.]|nr:ComEC/Rec2 family competence protein [Candidatus Equicola stercoris]